MSFTLLASASRFISPDARQEEVVGLKGIVFEIGDERAVVPLLYVAIGKEHVAFVGVQFGGPPKAGAAGGMQDGWAGRGIGGEVAVASQHGAGLGEIGIHTHEVAQVGVLKAGKVRGGGAFFIHAAVQDAGGWRVRWKGFGTGGRKNKTGR